MCAAEIDRPAIENELISFRMKIPQPNGQVFVLFDVGSFQPESQRQQFWMKLVPRFHVAAERNFQFSAAAVFIPRYGTTPISGQIAVSVACPLRPVALPILTRINIECRAGFGMTCTSSIHTRPVVFELDLPDDSVPTHAE